MTYKVSVLNMNDGIFYTMGEFTNSDKAIKFAEKLFKEGYPEVNVINTIKQQIVCSFL